MSDVLPRRRLVLAGCALVVLGSVVVASVTLVRRLLDPELYLGALDAADAYERVYTEVLADPELADLANELAGGLQPVIATQGRALATSTLRLTLPPSTLRSANEAAVRAVLAYVRGDADSLEVDVPVGPVLDRLATTAVVDARARLAQARDQVAPTLEAFRASIRQLVDRLAAGAVPDAVAVLGPTGEDPAAVVDAILDPLGSAVDEGLRDQITAAVLAGEGREALVAAASTAVTAHALGVSETLRASIEDGARLDVVTELADRAGARRSEITARLDGVRAAVAWTVPLGVLGAALAALGLGIVISEHRGDRTRGALVLGGCAVVSGAVVGLGTLVVFRAVPSPLAPATGTGPDSWQLPSGLRALLADIQEELSGELAATAARLSLGLALGGLVLGVGAVLLRRPWPARARPALVALGVATAGLVVVASVAGTPGSADDEPCNGAPELCDRRYDQVVYGATHNSMSSPDVVDIWPEHDVDIRGQLDTGVRALLIDTHYWTELVSAGQLQGADRLLSTDQAERLRSLVADRAAGREGTWLCHNHCVFGGMPFVDALHDIRRFLEENDREVVTLIIQDAITPTDTARAFAEAGLEPYLHVHRSDRPWATLGELIERDERLVVFAEDAGPPPPWYHHAFGAMQETPFLFLEPARFSCVPNRGDPDAELFLLNHWVQRIAPDRVDSVVVNSRRFLMDRARQCQAERGRLANFIAVELLHHRRSGRCRRRAQRGRRRPLTGPRRPRRLRFSSDPPRCCR